MISSNSYKNYFEGHLPRNCGVHYINNLYRAWCLDCGEWCYPFSPCIRCITLEYQQKHTKSYTEME